MTQKSIMWTTGSTGDGASEYTMAELIRWLRQTYLSDSTDEGVLNNCSDELAVSGTSSPVAVAAGGALIYGFPYWLTAATTMTIPKPTGDTRVDRVVLEADWTAQQVRLTRVAGTEGAGAPALTQTDTVEWQISLAQCSITTGGVITVTDEREFIHPNWEIEAAQLGDDLDGDGLQGGDGSAFAVDVGDFAGDSLSDDGSENLDVNVDDTTIELSGDALQVKAGGLDNSHMTTRARRFLVQATGLYNVTNSVYIEHEDNVLGWPMPDAKESQCYGVFRVPSDYVSTGFFQGYVIGGGNGDAAMRLYAVYGADGEAYNAHSAQSSAMRYPTLTLNQIDEADDSSSVALSSLAAGDVVELRCYRDGTDISDDINATVYFVGFIFSYLADM